MAIENINDDVLVTNTVGLIDHATTSINSTVLGTWTSNGSKPLILGVTLFTTTAVKVSDAVNQVAGNSVLPSRVPRWNPTTSPVKKLIDTGTTEISENASSVTNNAVASRWRPSAVRSASGSGPKQYWA